MNKRAVGNLGEDAACDALRREGCEILARNFRRPTGVIDVVARDRKTVVFVEVLPGELRHLRAAFDATDVSEF